MARNASGSRRRRGRWPAHCLDVVDQLRLQRRIGGDAGIVGRVLQALLGDGVAVDPEDPHEVGRLAAELGLLAGGKADHLRVELELLEAHFGLIDRPAGQPAGVDRFVELRRPAAGDAGAAAVGVGPTEKTALKLTGRREASSLPFFLKA